MRIDQPRHQAGPPQIQLIAVEANGCLELSLRTDPDDAATARRQGGVMETAERVIFGWHHGRQLTGVTDDEVG
jgi:hypothetical protein